MAAEDYRLLHETVGNFFRKLSAKSRCGNLRNHTVLDVLNERGMDIRKAGCGKVKILESHLRKSADNHIHDLVSASEMVVERNRHSVLQAAEPDGVVQCNHLGFDLLEVFAECSVLRSLP